MAYYPVMVDLNGRRCVVVGGGEVAERKVETLLCFGAHVHVVSPVLTPTLEAWASEGQVTVERRHYQDGDLEGAALAIGATDDREVQERVASEAKQLGILVNIVDDPELCTFIAPSIVKRGDLVIAISTGGASPALARQIRQELELAYGQEYAEVLEALQKLRERAKRDLTDPGARQAFLKRIARLDLFELFKRDRSAWEGHLEALFEEALGRSGQPSALS